MSVSAGQVMFSEPEEALSHQSHPQEDAYRGGEIYILSIHGLPHTRTDRDSLDGGELEEYRCSEAHTCLNRGESVRQEVGRD